MAILQIPTLLPAQTGIFPQTQKMVVSDNLAILTTAGYLNSGNLQGASVSANDIFQVIYSANPRTLVGPYVECTVNITNGVITLVPNVNPGSVILPVVSGDFANFSGTTGAIKDSGFSPSDATKTKVSMVSGATVVGHVADFSDIHGTVADSGFVAANIQDKTNIKAGTSTVNSPGTGPWDVTISGLTGSSVAVVNTIGSSAGGDIHPISVGCSTNTLTISLNANPGASYAFNYVIFVAPQ